MLQKWSRYKILQLFFDSPRKDFFIREISRSTNLAQTSVRNHLNGLLKEKLIIKEKKVLYPSFRSNRNNEKFRILKKQNLVLQLFSSGLINLLEKKLHPNCIVLFGSANRGEDIERSDIDLFIHAEEENIDLKKFEKILNRKISIFFENKPEKLAQELLSNLVNGSILSGYLELFENESVGRKRKKRRKSNS